jgi:hypothetical protein
MNKLQQAVEDGKIEAQKLKDKLADKELAELIKEKILFQENIKYWVNKLTKDDYIFNLIKDAITVGKKSVYIENGTIATVQAINNNPDVFSGIHTHYTSGYNYVNSDDVKEDWEHVEITWDEK